MLRVFRQHFGLDVPERIGLHGEAPQFQQADPCPLIDQLID
jgi:hypothetical protein